MKLHISDANNFGFLCGADYDRLVSCWNYFRNNIYFTKRKNETCAKCLKINALNNISELKSFMREINIK